MTTALSTLSVLPTTKTEISHFFELLKRDILDGNNPPEHIAIMLKSMEDLIVMLRTDKDIKDHIQSAADNYSSKSFVYADATFTKMNRATYNYKNCEDPEWLRLSMEEMKLKAAKKARETWLRTIKEPTPDPETGEIINPPAISNTEVISIKLKQ